MKLILPLLLVCGMLGAATAQAQHVNQLPSGRYVASLRSNGSQWERGDILLVDATRYRISGQPEEGEYRTSITAQRIFFTSGPLKGAFARLTREHNRPAIVFPQAENGHQQLASADVVAVLKQ